MISDKNELILGANFLCDYFSLDIFFISTLFDKKIFIEWLRIGLFGGESFLVEKRL